MCQNIMETEALQAAAPTEQFILTMSFAFLYKLLVSFFLPYLGFHAAHFVSANIYAYVCANPTLYGYVISLVTTGSPVCSAILQTMLHTSNGVSAILFASAASILSLLGSAYVGKPA